MYPDSSVNVPIHENIPQQYGPCNILTLQHLQQAASLGHVEKFNYGPEMEPKVVAVAEHDRERATSEGADAHVVSERATAFIPETTMRTFQWLCRAE